MADKHVPPFSSADLFKRFSTQMTTRVYRDKQAIFAQGDKSDAMFYIQAGNVKLTVISKRGGKAVVAVLRQGDFFGVRMSGKAIQADVNGDGDSPIHDRAGHKGKDCRRHPEGACLRNDLYRLPAGPY